MSDDGFTADDIVRIQTEEIERVKTLQDDGPHGLAVRLGVWEGLFSDFMRDLQNSPHPETQRDIAVLQLLRQGAREVTIEVLNSKAEKS